MAMFNRIMFCHIWIMFNFRNMRMGWKFLVTPLSVLQALWTGRPFTAGLTHRLWEEARLTKTRQSRKTQGRASGGCNASCVWICYRSFLKTFPLMGKWLQSLFSQTAHADKKWEAQRGIQRRQENYTLAIMRIEGNTIALYYYSTGMW